MSYYQVDYAEAIDDDCLIVDGSIQVESPTVRACACGHFWFQGMTCPHCLREVM